MLIVICLCIFFFLNSRLKRDRLKCTLIVPPIYISTFYKTGTGFLNIDKQFKYELASLIYLYFYESLSINQAICECLVHIPFVRILARCRLYIWVILSTVSMWLPWHGNGKFNITSWAAVQGILRTSVALRHDCPRAYWTASAVGIFDHATIGLL